MSGARNRKKKHRRNKMIPYILEGNDDKSKGKTEKTSNCNQNEEISEYISVVSYKLEIKIQQKLYYLLSQNSEVASSEILTVI